MKHVLSWISAAIALALAAGNVVAGSSAQISFSPQRVDASVGAAVAVDVTVANVDPDPGLAAYDLTLQFDPAVVRLDDLSDSGFITGGENVVICVPGQIDNAGGSANATCTAIPLFGAPGVSTTEAVALLHASFTTLAAGTSALTLSGSLSGPAGTAIAASFGGGTIRVTTASQPASSPTTAITASATPSTVASPALSAAASTTPRAEATPIANTPTRAAPAAPTKTPQASAPSNGGDHGTSILILIALLTAGAVAIGVTGSILVGRRLRRKNGS